MTTRMHLSLTRHWPYCVLAMVVASTLLISGPSFGQKDLTMLEEPCEGSFVLGGSLKVVDPATLDVRIAFNYQENGDCYSLHLTGSSVALERISGEDSVSIGRCETPAGFEAGEELPLTVRRGEWRIAVICGNQVLVRAYDSSLSGGQAGYTTVGAELDDVMLQPLGEVYLTDDFVREEAAQSAWEAVQGTWKTQSLRVDEQSDRMEADKSANAFSYWGKGKEGALAVTGYWFWSNYSVRAGMRATGTDVMGLVAYYRDPENYLLARWNSALAEGDDANELQLVQVTDGAAKIIAQAPGGHLPDHWYSMKLNVCEDVVQCFIDGELKISTRCDLFGQGQPGLFCEGTAGTFFDSVAIHDWETLSDAFDPPVPGKWVALAGSWDSDGNGLRSSAASGERLCATGRDSWKRYVYAADLYSDGPGVGLVACHSGDMSYVLRFGLRGSGYAGKAQLVKRTSEGARTLAETSAYLKAKTWHRAKLVVDDGLLTGYLDGKRILDAFDAEARGGQIGLYADGKGTAIFDDAYLYLLPEKRTTRLTKEFTEGDAHPEMAEWASTRAPWIKPEQEGNNAIWWTKGDYHGDKTVKLSIPSVGSATGSVRLWLDAAPEVEGSGTVLVIEATKGSKSLKAKLLSGDKQLDEAEIETENDPCPVVFERKGTFLVAEIDGKVVFSLKQ